MLILKRQKNESVVIGHQLRVTILELGKTTMKLGVDASGIQVFREELYTNARLSKDGTIWTCRCMRTYPAMFNVSPVCPHCHREAM